MIGSNLIPDSQGPSRFLPWVVAVMVFFAALAGFVGLVLNQATGNWRDDLANTITVEIGHRAETNYLKNKDTKLKITAVTQALSDTPGVIEVRLLDNSEIAELLRPWLGGGNFVSELPIPYFIDVKLSPDLPPNLLQLEKRLNAIGPSIKIDDHKIHLEKLVQLSRSLQLMIIVCLAMICFATSAVVIFGTRSTFIAHFEVVELLNVMGARDGYIARLFLWRAMVMGLKGGFIGLAVTATALFFLLRLAGDLGGAFLDNLFLPPQGLLMLAVLPFWAALLTAVTARQTVLRELSRIS